jgi:hypothetical protein
MIASACCGPTTSPWSLSREDRAALDNVDLYLRRGLDLKRWWDQASATDSFAEKFRLTSSFGPSDESFGFFDVAQVDGREMPIMGNYQAIFYDQPKSPTASKAVAAQWMRDQIRQFALRYFMRVSSFQLPEAFVPPGDRRSIPDFLRPLSWCPEENPQPVGFGFQQHFYKLAGSGRIGAFPEADRYAIVDLREIGPVYEWILPSVNIFNFNFTTQPFGPGTPKLSVPLEEGSYLVMTRDFVVNEEEPSPDLLGRYGFGYAFIKNPPSSNPVSLAYGPGEFDAAIEIIQWSVDKAGMIRSEAIFVVNRPTSVASVSLNPLRWGYAAANLLTLGASRYVLEPFQRAWELLPGSGVSVDPSQLYITAANLLTGGLAAQDFCISLRQLEKDFLVQHFQQHHETLVGSLETWRQIPNWLDTAALPEWVKTGRSG